jgi:outer membrane protein OmpA-like peptidoglycan-associated protein
MVSFCTACGSPLQTDERFCFQCGAPIPSAPAPARSVAPMPAVGHPAPSRVVPPPVPAPSVPKSSSPLRKIILALLTVFALFAVLAMGTCAYIGYRAKKKADEIAQAWKAKDVGKLAESLGAGQKQGNGGKSTGDSSAEDLSKLVGMLAGAAGAGVKADASPSYPAWKPTNSPSKIPLRAGLMVVASHHLFNGDPEAIERIDSATSDVVGIAFSSEDPGASGGPPRHFSAHRTVLRKDLQDSHRWVQNVNPGDADLFPGTTAISLSAQVLTEMNQKGEASFERRESTLEGLMAIYKGNQSAGAPSDFTTCQLKRSQKDDVAFPLLVNDQWVTVAAAHLICVSPNAGLDMYILDDPQNALLLGAAATGPAGLGERWQVVKISFPPDQPTRQIEKAIEQTGRAEVYGIYFSFASAAIREESQPVLKEIADTLARNPSWKLSVEGHTDNIGGDAFNLDLSKRRAEAVKQELVTHYHIEPDRLTTVGYGATRPKESNDTLEGRARNRRVELVRQ